MNPTLFPPGVKPPAPFCRSTVPCLSYESCQVPEQSESVCYHCGHTRAQHEAAAKADPYNAPRFSLADLAAMIHQARPAAGMGAEWQAGVNAGREVIANLVCDRLDSLAEQERFMVDSYPSTGQKVGQ